MSANPLKSKTARRLLSAVAVVALVLPAATSSARPAKNRIEAVDAGEREGATTIAIRGTRTPTFTVYKLKRPSRVVIDIANAGLAKSLRGTDGTASFDVNSWGVSQVSAHALEGSQSVVRVVVRMARPGSYKVKAVGDDVVVHITPRDAPPEAVASSSAKAEAKRARAEVKRAKKEAKKAKSAAKKAVADAEKMADKARAAEKRAKQDAAAARLEASQARAAARRARDEADSARNQAKSAKDRAERYEATASRRVKEAKGMLAEADRKLSNARKTKASAEKAEKIAGQRSAEAKAVADRANATASKARAEAKRLHAAALAAAKDGRRNAKQLKRDAEAAAVKAERQRRVAEKATAKADARRAEAVAAATKAKKGRKAAVLASQQANEQRKLAESRRRKAETGLAKAKMDLVGAEKRRAAAEKRAVKAVATAEQIGQSEKKAVAAAKRAQREAGKLRGELATAQKRVETLRNEKVKSDERLARLTKQNSKNKAALARVRAERDRTNAQVDKLRAEREKLQVAQKLAEKQAAKPAAATRAARIATAAAEKKARAAERRAASARKTAAAATDKAKADAASARADADRARKEAKTARADAERATTAAKQARSDAKRAAEKRKVAAEKRKVADAKRTKAPAKAGPAAVREVDYVDRGGVARVVINLEGKARPKVISAKGRKAVLEIEDASIADALERTLDTTRYGGPISAVSSYRDPRDPNKVRVVVDLSKPTKSVLKRKGTVYYWDFDKPKSAAKAKPAAVGAKRPKARPSVGTSTPITSKTVAQSRSRRRKVYRGRKIDLDFKDADIHNLLRLLADVGGVNIVIPDEIRATVTVRLRNVPWDQALEVILQSKGLWYRREGTLIRIASRKLLDAEDKAEAERIASLARSEAPEPEVYTLNYAKANRMRGRLVPLLSPKGRIEVDARTNSLIINDIKAHRRRVVEMINRLDTQTPQIQIEARIVEARTTFQREFGIQWGGRGRATQAGGNSTGLIFPNDVEVAGAADDGSTNSTGVAAAPTDFAVNMPAAIGTGAGGGLGFSFGSVGGNFGINLRLSAAEDEGSIRIVSAPKITTLNNVQAAISQGVSIPISVISAGGVQTQFVPADLSLKVTPHVSQRDCSVVMDIAVTKNEADFANTGARGDPSLLRKEARTSILVADGETSVIGGVYTRSTGWSRKKVPFFADLPFIGWMFRNKSETDVRTEVLVFITPKITNRAFLRCE